MRLQKLYFFSYKFIYKDLNFDAELFGEVVRD